MYDYECEVKRVWDGDTFDGIVELGFLMQIRGRFRMLGINAPELDTPEGVISGNYLRQRIENKKVVIVLVNPKQIHAEKFGRWLVIVSFRGVNINQEMRVLGYAEGTGDRGIQGV